MFRSELGASASLLAGYGWYGNVRELRSMMERIELANIAEHNAALIERTWNDDFR
ncbi:hypothetical protein [Actimicrobium antarcticum]|uniref:hypothetical protein n=1 Tax=Actimicrobium antarcticum TaxID=1051899 RepID=UPI0031D941EE